MIGIETGTVTVTVKTYDDNTSSNVQWFTTTCEDADKCCRCGIVLDNDNWPPSRREKRDYICKECSNKRSNESRYRNGLSKPLGTNPDCASYLGVYITEQILSSIYKNVERMPFGHPGYDFICGLNYKVDCKSSCRRKMKDSNDRWMFHIEKNTTADYFICVAFNNRDDLRPEHIWLIPGYMVNHLVGLSISTTTIDNWTKYEQIDKLDIWKDEFSDSVKITMNNDGTTYLTKPWHSTTTISY